MIAPVVVLGKRRAAKFAAPPDQGVFEKPTGFQITEQTCDGLVHGAGMFGMLRHVGMLIPFGIASVVVTVVDLNVTNPCLGHLASHQTLTPVVIGFLFINTVEFERRFRFSLEVHQLRRGRLHAKGKFKGIEVGHHGIGGLALRHLGAIDALEQLKAPELFRRAQALIDDVLNLRILHRLLGLADGRSLMHCRKEGVAVILRATHACGRADGHKGGHVGVLCAEPVTDPASYRGAHGVDRAGVEKEGGGTMRHPFGVHAVNEAKLVDVFGCFWKQEETP